MDQNTHFKRQEIPVRATLDVEAVEAALGALWRESAGSPQGNVEEDGALMRARVLNLMVYLTSAGALDEVNRILADLTRNHPCRALLILAEADAEDRDIEINVSAYCPESSDAGGRRVCCEQVTLRAGGRFTIELPSATTPLLVSDLPVFLYWWDAPRPDSHAFRTLCDAATRVVIDSAGFPDAREGFAALVQFVTHERASDAALSDLNWARLTSWRALLASFYDAQDYREALGQISRVTIEYVAPSGRNGNEALAPQALMMAGWLASRLGWRPLRQDATSEAAQVEHESGRRFLMEREGREVVVELRRVERPEMKPGRLARVELRAESAPVSTFVVSRSDDGLYLETRVARGANERAARVLKVRNRSAAVLVGRELEIICHDAVYEDALKAAAAMT